MPTYQEDTDAALSNERAAYKALLEAGGSGLPTLNPSDKVKAHTRYLLPRQPTGASWRIDKPGVEVIGTGFPVWPSGGVLFNVVAGGDDFTSTDTLFDHPNPTVNPDGKWNVPNCIYTVAKNTRAIRPTVRKVSTFCKAEPGADGTTIEGVDAEGYSSYILYAGGANNSLVRGGRIGAGKIETPLRATEHLGKVPDGFTVLRVDITANPRKTALDLRNVVNAAVGHCTIRQPARRDSGKIMTAVRLGMDSGNGCDRLVYWDNTHIGGQLWSLAQVSGILYGNRWHDVDPAVNDDIPIQCVAGTLRIFDTTAYYKGEFPVNAQPIATIPVDSSNKWEQVA